MQQINQIIEETAAVYEWLDAQLAGLERTCRACGNCCDFEAYGHRLFVSTPELLYFRHFAGLELKSMPSGVCPYRVENKCTAYARRFAGCRIFDCGTDAEAQSLLCEETLGRFKRLCEAYGIEYRYLYLKEALSIDYR